MKRSRTTHWVTLLFALALAAGLVSGCSAASEAPMTEASAPMASAAPQAAPAAEAPVMGFGGIAKNSYDTAAMEEQGYYDEDEMEEPAEAATAGGSSGGAAVTGSQAESALKIIREAQMSIQSKAFDEDYAFLQQMASDLGGYVQSSNVSGRKPVEWNEAGRYAYVVLRIPGGKLEEFLSAAGNVGEVVGQQLGSEDVTSHYYDTESRVNTLKIQLERLQAILTESQSLADIITLESEIARVQYEIESLTTDLRRLDRLVDYATVTIELQEVTQFERPQSANPTLNERIGNAFRRSLNSMIDFGEGALVFLVSLVPVLPVLLVIALIVWLIVRLARKQAKKREQKMEQQRLERQAKMADYNSGTGKFSAPADAGTAEQTKDEPSEQADDKEEK